MSSSKIIKSGSSDQQISPHAFAAVLHGGSVPVVRPKEKPAFDFTPMELFDPSELQDKGVMVYQPTTEPDDEPAEETAPPPPPGRYICDEELEQLQDESYERGLQDGKSLAERGLVNVFKTLRTAAEELEELRDKVLRDAEDDLLALTLAITRKVVAREVRQDRQIVLQLIRAALQNLHEKDDLLIRVHPDDHALLTTSQSEALQAELAGVSFTLKADSLVEIGSCQIETVRGTVDAGFEAQLEEVYRRLVEERTDAASGEEAE